MLWHPREDRYWDGDMWIDDPQPYDPYGTRDTNYTYGTPDDQPQAGSSPAAPPAQNTGSTWPPTGSFGPGDQRINPSDGQPYVYDGSNWIPWNNGDNPFANKGGMHTPIPGAVPAGTPYAGTGGGGGGQDLGGAPDGAFDGSGFQWPQYSGPTYTPTAPYSPAPYTPVAPFERPAPFSYPSFSFADFVAPTLAQAQQEPGYQFAADEGRRAVEQGAANRGTFRTGATLKDLFAWGNKFGEQNYGNVYNRAANTYGLDRANNFGNWQANRNNAADNYSTNYGISRDVWDRGDQQNKDTYNITDQGARNAFTLNSGENQAAFDRNRLSSLDAFNPQMDAAKLSFDDLYRRWKAQLDAQTSVATAGAGL